MIEKRDIGFMSKLMLVLLFLEVCFTVSFLFVFFFLASNSIVIVQMSYVNDCISGCCEVLDIAFV